MGFTVLEGYGLTETAPVRAGGSLKQNRAGSVGKPLPGVEINIVKLNAADKVGEIFVRGPNVMKGYYKMPQLTEEVLSRDGWFKTGDIGWMDQDNYLYLTGRSKHIIITRKGWENVLRHYWRYS